MGDIEDLIITGNQAIGEYIKNIKIFGISWLLGAIISGITVILITRDSHKAGEIFFPIVIMWAIVGLNIGVFMFIISALFYATSILLQTKLGERLFIKIRQII